MKRLLSDLPCGPAIFRARILFPRDASRQSAKGVQSCKFKVQSSRPKLLTLNLELGTWNSCGILFADSQRRGSLLAADATRRVVRVHTGSLQRPDSKQMKEETEMRKLMKARPKLPTALLA